MNNKISFLVIIGLDQVIPLFALFLDEAVESGNKKKAL
jgi:hypothetical protein